VRVEHLDIRGVADLGDDGQPRLLARLRQDLEGRFAQPLERVRAGARLERPAAQQMRAGGLDTLRDLQY
jgi:hypothetical protein